MKTKVYAVQQQHVNGGEKFDFRDAERYGEVEILLPHSASPFDLPPVLSTLQEKLAEYSEHDWIIPCGNPILIGLVMAIAADANGGTLRVLQWQGGSACYIPITMESIYGKGL